MDRNTIIGFILIFAVLMGFSYLNRPTPEQIEAQKRYQDSIAWVQQQQPEEINSTLNTKPDKAEQIRSEELPDSVIQAQLFDLYGSFGASAQGTEELITLENELIEIKLSTKGGRVYSARLKNFTDYTEEPLYLFDGNESGFGVTFITSNNRVLNSNDFYFEAIRNADRTSGSIGD